MSIRERGMKWVLPLIVTSVLYSNACPRTTSVRLGMSKHHFTVDENHFQERCDEGYGMWNYNDQIRLSCMLWMLWVLWVWVNLVRQFTFISALRIISVLAASFLNTNASSPIWMEVNSGKSSQSLTSQSITLKHNKRTTLECTITKEEGFERRHV